MKLLLASSALAIAFAVAPAHAQQPQQTQPPVTAETTTEGSVKVEGIAPSQVLGAIHTEELVDETAAKPQEKTTAEAPPSTGVVVDRLTTVEQTENAVVKQTTEVVTPVSDRPAIDPDTPIAPEVQAVVDKKKRYTTADIVAAQLEAVRSTPVSEPSTVTTTTTVIPDPG